MDNNKISALLALCDVQTQDAPKSIRASIEAAPDPETAVQGVFSQIPMPSEQLARKWRQTAVDLWREHHPQAFVLPELQLTQEDVAATPVLMDAKALLAELTYRPGQLRQQQKGNWHLPAHEVVRLSQVLPHGTPEDLPRLGALLESLRLVRQTNGELVPTFTRLKRWRKLPLVEQWYSLWHADAYHVPWENLKVIQDNITALWEALNPVVAGVPQELAEYCREISQVFFSTMNSERLNFVLKEVALPQIISNKIFEDLFARHGLLVAEQSRTGAVVTWTNLGQQILATENEIELPCSVDLLR